MACPQKQNLYIYIEDYIVKEKNLRFLLKKVSQNFVVQESFSETMLRAGIVTQNFLNKHPYYCDFALLELMDAIWMNETYRRQRENLIEITKKEISLVHHLDRIHELIEKKETFRKIINLIHQMEFNFENESPFLAATNTSLRFTSGKSDNQGISCQKYKDLEMHLRKTVRQMLKQIQSCSQTVSEFVAYCQQYESYEFHKIQELEYFYIVTKKHYLSKAFCKEFQIRLENNKFQKSQPSSGNSSPTLQHPSFMDLNLNQIIPCELLNSFFHQLLRNLMKEPKFKEFMESDQFMQSLFILFHIDQQSKYRFTMDLNQHMVQYHQQLNDLRRQYPDLYGDDQINEEIKQSDSISEKVGYEPLYNNSQQSSGPFTLIDEEDDLVIEPMSTPELNRGYSDQKRQYQKEFKSVVFSVFQKTERDFDFINMIEKMRQEEHQRMVVQLQAQINQFNQTIQQRQQQQQLQINNVAAISQPPQIQPTSSAPVIQSLNRNHQADLLPLPDLDDFDLQIDEDLPDPSSLMANFSMSPRTRQQSQSLTNDSTFHGFAASQLLIGPGMNGFSQLNSSSSSNVQNTFGSAFPFPQFSSQGDQSDTFNQFGGGFSATSTFNTTDYDINFHITSSSQSMNQNAVISQNNTNNNKKQNKAESSMSQNSSHL